MRSKVDTLISPSALAALVGPYNMNVYYRFGELRASYLGEPWAIPYVLRGLPPIGSKYTPFICARRKLGRNGVQGHAFVR